MLFTSLASGHNVMPDVYIKGKKGFHTGSVGQEHVVKHFVVKTTSYLKKILRQMYM